MSEDPYNIAGRLATNYIEAVCLNTKNSVQASMAHAIKVTHIVCASNQMLEALENLENDDGHIPEFAWKMVQDAIASAKRFGNEA